MKTRTLFTAIVVLQSLMIFGQDKHTLRILKDDPNSVSDHIIGINGCDGHFSKNEHLKAGLGIEGIWSFNPKVEAQGSLMWYYLAIRNADGPDFTAEVGGAYTFGMKTKKKEVKIILKYSETKTETATEVVKTSSVKYLVSEATYLTKTKFRAGLNFKKAGMDDGSEGMDPPLVEYTGIGIYGGIEISKQACLFSEVDGKKGVTSGYTRFYIDGLFLPVSKFEGSTIAPSKIGGRIGYEAFYNPNKKKNAEYGELQHYQVYPTLFWKIEAGMRGGDGWFFQMGIGFLVYRNR